MKKLLFLAVAALLIVIGCNNQNSIYDITVKDIDGSDVSLANYKGKVLLIVNVASKCGLTPLLVSKDGKTILRFEPMVTPDMLEEAIQEMLK